MPKLDTSTIHGISTIGAGIAAVVAQALGVVAAGGTTQAALAVAAYGLLHIFLPQNTNS